jgi:hypothetical protein
MSIQAVVGGRWNPATALPLSSGQWPRARALSKCYRRARFRRWHLECWNGSDPVAKIPDAILVQCLEQLDEGWDSPKKVDLKINPFRSVV